MRRITRSVVLALALTLASVGIAQAHVHPVTPLGCNPNDNAATSGALRTNTTPAAAVNGGPISGVIPRNATPGDQPGEAGRHSSLCD